MARIMGTPRSCGTGTLILEIHIRQKPWSFEKGAAHPPHSTDARPDNAW
jgi:hypothetical protein